MNFDDTAKFGNSASTLGEHLCPQCELNGRSTWTQNKIFCDYCIAVRESFGFWEDDGSEDAPVYIRRKCRTNGCRRIVTKPRIRYCPRCAVARKREAQREHIRRKRMSKIKGSGDAGAEALTKAENTVGYHHPQTSISDSSFSTNGGIAESASQADGRVDTAEQVVTP